jgi:hypothetical protein
MATQWTAQGITSGAVLPAATLNTIGAVWETWTPTVTAQTGSFTTVTVNLARYGRINKLVYGEIDFTITSIGTGAGIPLFTLPVTSAVTATLATGQYRETGVTGLTGVITYENTTQFSCRRYDNASPLGGGYRFAGSFQYEAA